jgi:hypothetical protein
MKKDENLACVRALRVDVTDGDELLWDNILYYSLWLESLTYKRRARKLAETRMLGSGGRARGQLLLSCASESATAL